MAFLRACRRRAGGRAGCRGVAGSVSGQCREVRHRPGDYRPRLRVRHPGSELFRNPHHRPRLGHPAGQPRDGFHPRIREPVRDIAPVQPDQLPGRAGSREPSGLCRPVQVVHEPRSGHPGLCLGEHDDSERRDRASGRPSHPLFAVRTARAQHRPPRAAEIPLLHVRREVVRDRRGRPAVVDLPRADAHHRAFRRHDHRARGHVQRDDRRMSGPRHRRGAAVGRPRVSGRAADRAV